MTNARPLNKEIVLEARLGSYAFGLSTPSSDIDMHGVWMMPTSRFLGLNPPNDKECSRHAVSPLYDYTFHELGKFCKLAIDCNPTVLELLWADEYTICTPIGQRLIDNRDAFLSTKMVKAKFGGYASGQAKNMLNAAKGEKAMADKSIRHAFRLLMTAGELLQTGKLRIKMDQSERETLFGLADCDIQDLYELFEEWRDKFQNLDSVLRDEPDYESIDTMIRQIRSIRP